MLRKPTRTWLEKKLVENKKKDIVIGVSVIKNGTFIATLLLYTQQFLISTLYIKNRKLEAL